MKTTSLRLLAFIIALACLTSFVLAGDSFDGTVEKAGDGKITIKLKDDSSRTFDVDVMAKITLDGKTAKLDDIKSGALVTVATEAKKDKTMAVAITAKSG